MTRRELAQRTGVSEKHISTVVSGEKGISTAFAHKLGYVFENAQFWINLQLQYDQEQMQLKEENSISQEELDILKPLHEITDYLMEHGLIHNDCGDAQKVIQLRAFLNVSDLTYIPTVSYNAAYRAQVASNAKVNPYVLFAWQRLCEVEAGQTQVSFPLDTNRLLSKTSEIKQLMMVDINEAITVLRGVLESCGIAFRVVRHFRGAPVQGFIKKCASGQLILCLTIRRQRADVFWFTLFHEIGHIIYGDYTARFVDFESSQDEPERRADKFAADTLIDPAEYRSFVRETFPIVWGDIEAFASRIGVAPYIVLGRLQNDDVLDWSDYSDRVPRLIWA